MDNERQIVNINEIERNNNIANNNIEKLTNSAEEVVSILKRLGVAYESEDTRDLIKKMQNKIDNIQHENEVYQNKASQAIIASKEELKKSMNLIGEELN